MHAIQLDEPNGSLTWRKVPLPRPQAGQVLIRMAAAPMNPSDLGSIGGSAYSGAITYPFTPGREGSGSVVAVGAGLMPRFLNGRRVACALVTGNGTWAEYMVTTAQLCVPLHRDISFEQGATLMVNPLTALAFFEVARAGKHRAIVSTAAASALGGMILRLGKRDNIPVIHIVRRQAQVELVRERGGEYILNSSNADFAKQLQDLVQKLNATLFLDAIGGNITQQLADAAPYDSTILLYGGLSGEPNRIDPSIALAKNLHFDGWFEGNYFRNKNLLYVLQLSNRAQSLLASDLHSPIHKRLPLAQAQAALDHYVKHMSAGKILLVADPNQVALDN